MSKIQTRVFLKEILNLPSDIIYKISKYCYKYIKLAPKEIIYKIKSRKDKYFMKYLIQKY